jgi:hypothetical protein
MECLNDQLFTELSPEQAAIVEGGVQFVSVLTIRALEAGGGSDSVFATFNGNDTSLGRRKFMRKNSVANLGQSSGTLSGPIRVRLRDASDNNRSLGSFLVSNSTKNGRATISGNGSKYEVSFSAF